MSHCCTHEVEFYPEDNAYVTARYLTSERFTWNRTEKDIRFSCLTSGTRCLYLGYIAIKVYNSQTGCAKPPKSELDAAAASANAGKSFLPGQTLKYHCKDVEKIGQSMYTARLMVQKHCAGMSLYISIRCHHNGSWSRALGCVDDNESGKGGTLKHDNKPYLRRNLSIH